MRFYKFSGAGNDFVIINNLVERFPAEVFPRLAARLCSRRVSIGADGLMIAERSEKADIRMIFYNSDGSEGEMCGNGARCICRFAHDFGFSGEEQTVETVSGLVFGRRIDARTYRVRLTEPSVIRPHFPVELDGKSYDCGYVELGSPGLPHAVLELPGLRSIPESELLPLGRALRSHPAFPKGANVNFWEKTGEDAIFERTFERGVEDFTLACGTGTGSTAVILAERGVVSPGGLTADMPGGRLSVELERRNGRVTGVYLTGPTNFVAEGIVRDEELEL